MQIIRTLGVITASGVAIWGVNKWKREVQWKRKYELAEEVLSLFYEAKDHLRMIRNPLSSGSEGSSRKINENETKEEKEALDRSYVFYERYEKVSDRFNNLRKLKYRFMALFGDDSVEPFLYLEKLLGEIMNAAFILGQHYWRAGERAHLPDDAKEKHFEEMRKYESKVWSGIENPDPIESKLEVLIKRIEKICKPVIMKD